MFSGDTRVGCADPVTSSVSSVTPATTCEQGWPEGVATGLPCSPANPSYHNGLKSYQWLEQYLSGCSPSYRVTKLVCSDFRMEKVPYFPPLSCGGLSSAAGWVWDQKYGKQYYLGGAYRCEW